MTAVFGVIPCAFVPIVYAEEAAPFNAPELANEITQRRAKVPEFVFIKDEAKKLGIRVWLFGGTASGYAHYVNWDLLREHGDKNYQQERFDYDYSNIYRSTQDLDIVIDGTADQAAELETALTEKFPHFQGSKSAWEVRLLKGAIGDKEALLNNPNYLNQHTDSNSTGLVELTDPPAGEAAVKDLRDWKSAEPFFLRDVHEKKLHYYFSPLHETTTRAAEGKNPPIFSVVRYLTKAFQYDLELRPEDVKTIQKIVADFDPKNLTDSYAAKWIEKNGKKLLQNAVNLEYAWKTLKELGLSQKLAAIKNNPEESDSLAMWMAKQPLLSEPVGAGEGKTALEIFKQHNLPVDEQGRLVVAHETRSYLAYESITRAHTGEPNVFISRKETAEEAAAHGEGFYTKAGKEGAAGTGLTIRFTLNPEAREGRDFHFVPEHGYFVIKNKNAFRVIPESLHLTLKQFFEILAQDDNIFATDQGVFAKLRRQMTTKIALMTEGELAEVAEVVKANLGSHDRAMVMLSEWLNIPVAIRKGLDPMIVKAALSTGRLDLEVLKLAAKHKEWASVPELKESKKIFAAWKKVTNKYLSDATETVKLTKRLPNPGSELIKKEYDAYLARTILQHTGDPKNLSRALSFVEDRLEQRSQYLPTGPEAAQIVFETVGDKNIDPELLGFYLRRGFGIAYPRDLIGQKFEQALLERYSKYKGALPTELAGLIFQSSSEGKQFVVQDWPRYRHLFPQVESDVKMNYVMSHTILSLNSALERGHEIDLERLRAITRNFRRYFLPHLNPMFSSDGDTALYLDRFFSNPQGSEKTKAAVAQVLREELVPYIDASQAKKTANYFATKFPKLSLPKTMPETCGAKFAGLENP